MVIQMTMNVHWEFITVDQPGTASTFLGLSGASKRRAPTVTS